MHNKLTINLAVWLALLVFAGIVPVVLFAGATLYRLSQESRSARDRGQVATARALALAVDGEIRAWKSSLQVLATSQSLRPDRLAEFYEEAQIVAGEHRGRIVLKDAAGQPLLSTSSPPSGPLRPGAAESLPGPAQNGGPLVSDLLVDQETHRYMVTVGLPVVEQGKTRYLLEMCFEPERLSRMILEQQPSPFWRASLFDRQMRVVARSRQPGSRVGKPAPDWFRAAVADRENGIADGVSASSGEPIRAAFHRLREAPWVLAISLPLAELPSSTPIWTLILVGLAVSLAAAGAALGFGLAMTRPIARLARAAEPILRGEAVDLGTPSTVRELRELQQALVDSGVRVRTSYEERERAADALRASEQRYRELVDTALDAVIVHRDGRFLFANPEALRLFGADTIQQLQRYGLIERLHPGDRQRVAARIQKVMAGGRAPLREVRVLRLDGQAVWAEAVAGPIEFEGQRAVQTVLRDISERQRAEDALRASEARAPAAVGEEC
jgi:two-component system, sensor histidine kinase